MKSGSRVRAIAGFRGIYSQKISEKAGTRRYFFTWKPEEGNTITRSRDI
jgi:hypothetical protein